MADLRPRRAGYFLANSVGTRVAFRLRNAVGTLVDRNFGAHTPYDPIA
ncbi:MAG: hypothetical protein IKG71_04740 [Firmicutes bacterium]|nr:hypothetical protein [Bacillota bacterium]